MIDINRHNYETFFLLYTDKELSVEEKDVVDKFVKANPDLQEELLMLQQSILKPDHIIFSDKFSLHKEDLIPTQLQGKLLLYLDKELNANERNELDGLMKTDTDIEKEWSLLQQTKFSPTEVIIFDNKKSLYRKESGRVVAFPWRRLAAAAIFIGFGVWGGLVYLNSEKKINNKEMAKSTPAKINLIDSVNVDKEEVAVAEIAGKVTDISATIVSTKKPSVENINKSAGKNLPATLSPGDKMGIVATEKSNNLPKPYFEDVNNNGSNISIAANVKPIHQPNNIVNPGNNIIDMKTEKESSANTFAVNTSFTDNGDGNNDRVLYMDEDAVKKTRLGGIFRKVKRVLERNANIKSGGNHIKVANLEFAIQ